MNYIDQYRLERATKKVRTISGFYRHLIVYLLVNGILLAFQYITLEPGEKFFDFGTFATLFFWGIGLLFHAIAAFVELFLFGKEWEERKIRELMNNGPKTKWE